MKRLFLFLLGLFVLLIPGANAQDFLFEFGTVVPLENSFGDTEGEVELEKIRWHQVNTEEDTWELQDSILVCKGLPIGVIRSSRQFENYILHVEWMHMEPGGNSGMFMWSSAVPGENRLPNGVEVQMLELDW